MAQSQQERDVAVLTNAETLSAADAVSLAKSHIQEHEQSGPSAERLREMGLYARASIDYRKELEQYPELAKASKEAMTLGAPMPKAEWAQAKELAGANGRVYLPKFLSDYSGKVVMVTDTHVVQQASKNSVVAHDLAMLDTRDELLKLNGEGKLQGKVLKVIYGSTRGMPEVMSFSQVRAAEIRETAVGYAEVNIKSAQGREAFIKHVEKMMAAEVERTAQKGGGLQPARQQRAPERTR